MEGQRFDGQRPYRRSMDIGAALKQTWLLFKHNWKNYIGLSAVKFSGLVVYFLIFFSISFLAGEFAYSLTRTFDTTGWIMIPIIVVVALGAYLILTTWADTGTVICIHSSLTGEKKSTGEMLREGSRALGRLMGLYLLLGFLAVLAFSPVILLITLAIVEELYGLLAVAVLLSMGYLVGVFWLWIRWGLAPFAVVVEGKGVGAALKRSSELIHKSFWATGGTVLLAHIIAGAASSLIAMFIYPVFLLMVLSSGLSGGDATAFSGLEIIFFILLAIIGFVTNYIRHSVVWSGWGGVWSQLKDRE